LCLWVQCKREYTRAVIVPTGTGAAIGGFAGDALPVARALSSVVDCLITHPNVMLSQLLSYPFTTCWQCCVFLSYVWIIWSF